MNSPILFFAQHVSVEEAILFYYLCRNAKYLQQGI